MIVFCFVQSRIALYVNVGVLVVFCVVGLLVQKASGVSGCAIRGFWLLV